MKKITGKKLLFITGVAGAALVGIAAGFPPGGASVSDSVAAATEGGEDAAATVAQFEPVMLAAMATEPARELGAAVEGKLRVSTDRATGVSSFVGVDAGGDLYPGMTGAAPAAKAAAFLTAHGSLFGIDDFATELAQTDSRADQYGNTRITYHQVHEGVPVFAGVMRAHVSADGRLTAVNGKFIPDVALGIEPTLAGDAALQKAAAIVSKQQPSARKTASLTTRTPTLMIYRSGLLKGISGDNHLVYEVEVTDQRSVREFVYVDAHTGKVIDQVTGVHGIKDRRVYEASYDPNSPELPAPAWKEGDLRPAADPAHEDEVYNAGASYNLFFNLSGGTYRSWDGADARMVTVNNDPTIVCPNANWNGTSTNYCTGTSSDDVVAHEWGHAYTQETSGLIYQWQSGALNESYSDIFGEVVDLINNREMLDGAATGGSTNDGPRSSDDTVCSEFGNQLPTPDMSRKWLMGEDAFLFAPLPPVGDAAIRDMWHPGCFGDPGHTQSGSNYSCSSGDAGGVHTNSGVPNRAFALLVDGDEVTHRDDGNLFVNPVTVVGIGLTKATHIAWRANSMYNTPASNFIDNADSLEQSCQDLIGVPLTKLVTTLEDGTGLLGENDDTIDPTPELSGEVITALDCESVTAAIKAVEMRDSVVEKCGFSRMLDPAPAPMCSGSQQTSYFSEDWEGGLPAGWSTGQDPVSKPVLDTAEWFLRSGDLPNNADGTAHPGSAMYQENRRDLGNCSTDDESGALWLESPEITVPAEGAGFMVFDHYVATEFGFDGGNLLISINSGAYSFVPGSAIVYNAYVGSLEGAPDNTNPKAGEPAWHGGNGGEVDGSWGQTQVDLGAAGALAGDTIRFRWELGQDGCNGNDGWYVDEIELFTCGGPPPPNGEVCLTYSGDVNLTNENIVTGLPSISLATVAGANTVEDVNIVLSGSHTYMGDLTIDLESAAGTTVNLFDGGRCGGDAGISVVLDDEADAVTPCSQWASGDTYQPDSPMTVFDGEDPNGDWTLTISDGFPLDEGTLDSWTLELCYSDQDFDSVMDVEDNCLLEYNPDQCNTNAGTGPGQDHFGNVCDADLDNNGIVNSFDLTIMRANFGQTGANDADLTCDGIVNTFDLAEMRADFGQAPGPSGIVP